MPEKMNRTNNYILPHGKTHSICKFLVLTALIALVSKSSVFATIYPTNLKYFKLVQTPAFEGDQILFIKLDREIYKYSGPDFNDVRVFDAKDKDIERIIRRMDEIGGFVPVPEYKISLDQENKATIIAIHTDKEPVTAFRLDIDPPVFEKKVTVQKVMDGETVDIVQKLIQTQVQDDAAAQNMTISFDETRNQEYRIVIDDSDSEPLKIVAVFFSVPEYRLYFQAQGNVSYQLYWGEPKVEPPVQDASFLKQALERDVSVKQARVGRGFANPRYGSPRSDGRSGDSGYSWALFPIIAVILAVSGLAFTKLGKRKE